MLLAEGAVRQCGRDQLPQEQEVGIAAGGECGQRCAVDRAPENRRQQLLDGGTVQIGDLQALEETVLPQTGDRVGNRLAGTDGEQKKDLLPLGEA